MATRDGEHADGGLAGADKTPHVPAPVQGTRMVGVTLERVRRGGDTAWRAGLLHLERHESLLGAVALAGVVAAYGAWLFREGRGLSFYLDEWYFPLYRLSPFTANSLLAPHNGHLVGVDALIYEALLRTFGMTSYTPYRSMVLVAHLSIGVLVYLFARRRLGPIAAVAPAAVILFLGKGAENTLFAFQIDFLGPVVTGLACLLLVDHRSLRARLTITGLLIVTIGFSEVGLAFLVAVAVALAIDRRWRDAWMVAIPGGLYVLWYLEYGLGQGRLNFVNFIHFPQFMAEAIAAAAGAAVGLDQNWGRFVAVILAYFVVVRIVRGGASRTLWALVAGAGFLWLLISLTSSSGGSPYASRYLYLGSLFIILIAVELARGRIQFGPIGIVALAAASMVIGASNLVNFYVLRDFFDSQAIYTRADLGALQIARAHVAPTYVFSDPSHGLPYVLASAYFAAVARYGSAAYTPSEIAAAPPGATLRVAADQALQRIEPLVVQSQEGSAALACHSAKAGQSVETDIGPKGVVVAPKSQPVQVSARRFAATGSVSLSSLDPGHRYLVKAQQDGSTVPWKLLTTSASTYSLCAVSG